MDTTIGLKDLYFSKITPDNATHYEKYGTPIKLAPAIKAAITPEYEEGELYADDILKDMIKHIIGGKIVLDVTEIGSTNLKDLLGAYEDSDGVVMISEEDDPPEVAVGFRAKKSDDNYCYIWLYRVKFSVPNMSFATKGKGITFNSPTIEGTFAPRLRPTDNGKHPVMITATWPDADSNDWFGAVPVPDTTMPS